MNSPVAKVLPLSVDFQKTIKVAVENNDLNRQFAKRRICCIVADRRRNVDGDHFMESQQNIRRTIMKKYVEGKQVCFEFEKFK